jgi:uracil phosphoribosyltransferase
MRLLHVIHHSLVSHYVTRLRDAATGAAEFREAVRRLAILLACEATRELELESIAVQTPLALTQGYRLRAKVVLVPILRAGLCMLEPVLDLLPEAEVRHVGIYRDEKSAEPILYYNKLAEGPPIETALVLDPMLATGGSSLTALQALAACGAQRMIVLSLIGAPEGIARIEHEFPDVPIYLAALDDHLDAHKHIVPGLGDAGDRMFGTGRM